jgi:hypothetical protein
MDLTLFAVTRALDVVVGDVWARHKARRLASNKWTKVVHALLLIVTHVELLMFLLDRTIHFQIC